jgi:hypothetical protein
MNRRHGCDKTGATVDFRKALTLQPKPQSAWEILQAMGVKP